MAKGPPDCALGGMAFCYPNLVDSGSISTPYLGQERYLGRLEPRPFPPRPGVGVTKAPFVNFSVSKIFGHAKVPVKLFQSHSYLSGVAAAQRAGKEGG